MPEPLAMAPIVTSTPPSSRVTATSFFIVSVVMKLPFMANIAKKKGLKLIRGTVVEDLLTRYKII